MKIALWLLIPLFFIGCNKVTEKSKGDHGVSYETIRYSKQFGILKSDSFRQVFYIHDKDTQWGPIFLSDAPPPRIAVLSTVFAGFMELLDRQDLLVAIDKTEFYSDSLVRKRIKEKSIVEVGEEGQLQIEKLLAQKPDYLICSTFEFNKNTSGERLEKLGVKILYCDNFKEQHPLARAEWIKFFGVVTGRFELADSLFDMVESNYLSVVDRNKGISNLSKPVIMVDAMFGDSWFVPGGNSFTAQLIADAGGSYIFRDKKPLFTYPLTLEDVLTSGKDADIWIHTNQYYSFDALRTADKRYTLFKPYATHRIYNNNKKENAYGGNDYWERGVGRPDLILSDLHLIFHGPDVQPDSLVYYKKLE